MEKSDGSSAIDPATEELDAYVRKVKMDPEVRRGIMTFGDLGDIPIGLSERLEDIQDMDYLKKLHKAAARVDSIEAFEEKMKNSAPF